MRGYSHMLLQAGCVAYLQVLQQPIEFSRLAGVQPTEGNERPLCTSRPASCSRSGSCTCLGLHNFSLMSVQDGGQPGHIFQQAVATHCLAGVQLTEGNETLFALVGLPSI